MKTVLLLICLALAACGPAEPKEQVEHREFMKDLGKCPDCGKKQIDLFGGYGK